MSPLPFSLAFPGVDVTGPHLFQIYPHGSTDKLPFTSMGSGSLAAMAILEAEYNEPLGWRCCSIGMT